MKKLLIFAVVVAFVGCSKTQSIQEYYVAKSEDPNFLVIDIPTSILGINNEVLNEEEQAALDSFQKLNVLMFRKTAANADQFPEELKAIRQIIDGEHATKTFGKLVYNEKLSANNSDVDITNSNINLGLSRVFFLTTQNSASASEMTINGLKPYLNVVQIGDKTEGKDVGSNPFYDYIDSNRTKNPNHKYLLLPISFKNYNSEGVGDYSEGLLPNISFPETLSNMGVLGDVEEPLLKKALEYISGQTSGSISINANSLPASFVELQTEAGKTIYFPKN